jgi:hypothetical protein
LRRETSAHGKAGLTGANDDDIGISHDADTFRIGR